MRNSKVPSTPINSARPSNQGPACTSPSLRPISNAVISGRLCPAWANCSVSLGTTKVIRPTTTASDTPISTVG
ncbi:hypothetical protein D3C79_1049030 [compost metagenome]